MFACVPRRCWWMPVPFHLCQWDLPKLWRLLRLRELPYRVQSIIWRRALWRWVWVSTSSASYNQAEITKTVGNWWLSWIWKLLLAVEWPRSCSVCLTVCCFMPDVDECVLPTTCPQGTCTNTEGSFTCITCQPGFRVSEDGQQCDGEAVGCVGVQEWFFLCLFACPQMFFFHPNNPDISMWFWVNVPGLLEHVSRVP